ncbi:S-adenosyl-L-methionine-dependent methyltransferase [Teratosphaeria nubilosa]|uniref:S-adenosyl-L-methionine-dependent methyltransferase n=1 Tax=Teratosphaeria nubilosa TaxID=161662 RepID=A0A6G1LM97_9PEZI|nr:S-adenosyl-L-methionine-dependent methyltransferase [Teratosphaeria nubilosa]
MSAFTEANRTAFNDLAGSYHSKPWQQNLSRQVSEALQQRLHWLGVDWSTVESRREGREVKLLDYACGTGNITMALGPYVSQIRGIDVSESMVEEYNRAALSSGLRPDQAHAVVGDLIAETSSTAFEGPEWHDFDIAVVGLGFHHFEDPGRAVKRLTERLNPGTGVLVIVDFIPSSHSQNQLKATIAEGQGPSPSSSSASGSMPDMSSTIHKDGFEHHEMSALFSEAGLESFEWSVLDEESVMRLSSETKVRRVFVARGRKAETASQKFWVWIGGKADMAREQLNTTVRRDGPAKTWSSFG